MMDERQREVAEFYARLANIKSLEALREGERLLLLDDLAVLAWRPKKITPETAAIWKKSLAEGKAGFQQAIRKNALWPPMLKEIHQQARALIWGLLEGRTVMTPPITLPQRPLRLSQEGIVEGGLETQYLKDGLMEELFLFLSPQQPFPFRRCPLCQTVFVPNKRQKFCSSNCTYKSIRAGKKEEKRDYMRTYMAKQRKRLKKPRQKAA